MVGGSRTGATDLLTALKAAGARYILGIPGVDNLAFWDALYGEKDLVPVVVRHESGAGYAADGYAKVSGQPLVCIVVPGPGATNIATSVLSAYGDSIPMVVITMQIEDWKMGRTAMHDCDVEGVFRPIVKKGLVVRSADDIGPAVLEAFRLSTEPRRGPVQVVVPADLLLKEIADPMDWRKFDPTEPVCAPGEEIERAAALLSGVSHPIIYAGAGVADAGATAQLQAVAERLSAPVLTSISARGVIPEDHPLSFGLLPFVGGRDLLDKADACLAVGTSFSEASTFGWRFQMPQRMVQIDNDSGRIGRNYPAEIGLLGDAKLTLEALNARLTSVQAGNDLARMVARLKDESAHSAREFMSKTPGMPIHPGWMVSVLRERADRNAIFTSDGSMTESWLFEQSFQYYEPRCLLTPVVSQTMGYALPAAIGAKLAAPQRQVFCLTGDGSIQMSLSELATARNYGVGITVIVFNDGYYNALRFHQKYSYNERYVGIDLGNPDFAGVAESFGIKGYRIRKPADFVDALEEAMRSEGPSLIDVAIDPDALSRRWQDRADRMKKEKQVAVTLEAR